MNEIPQILEPKEKVIYDGKPEYAPYITGAIFGILIAVVVIGIFIGAFLKSILIAVIAGIVIFILGIIISNMAYTRTHYAITNKRAIVQTGIIGRDFKSIDYDRMQNVSVDVGILGVIFKVGSVKIFTGEMETVDGKHPRIQPKYDRFNYVASPYEVLKKLQTHLSVRKEELA
jgi:uncharacterized membrane protein YdbT with pleckstrin-like domain